MIMKTDKNKIIESLIRYYLEGVFENITVDDIKYEGNVLVFSLSDIVDYSINNLLFGVQRTLKYLNPNDEQYMYCNSITVYADVKDNKMWFTLLVDKNYLNDSLNNLLGEDLIEILEK